MRRHRNPERYVDSFDRCKEEIEKLLPQIEHDQRTDDIFAALMNEDNEDEQSEIADGVERLSIPPKTDIWERYTLTKTHYPDHLALIRVGDFYELFEQDAVEASDTLELTLTGRDVKGKPTRVPMCGFPYHTMDKFLQKLLDKGYKVAVAEEDKTLPIKETTRANKNYTDADIAAILPAKGKDILKLYEYRFSDDRFYVDEEKGTVTWLYFNPDSTAKGQFIESIVTFEQIAALKENEDFDVFFDKLGTEAKQYIVDSDDKEFRDTAYRFLTDEYTFRGFGTEVMEQLVFIAENYEQGESRRTAEELAYDRAEEAELTAVSRFLRATRMDDIDLYFNMGEIVAKDSSNEWRGKEFYEFLLNDAIALDENLDPVDGISINDETLNPVIELAEKYGANIVRVGAENTKTQPTESEVKTVDGIIYRQYQKCKEMYPRRLVMLQHGNNYYFFDKDAEKVQSILKSKPTETVMVNG